MPRGIRLNYIRKIFLILLGLSFVIFKIVNCLPTFRYKRAFSYIANETACTVDNIVYKDGDLVPSDDPCETCRCRPPGFTCSLKHCPIKTGCRTIRKIGECCPTYQCGCEHDGKYYKDGERIHNAESLCYSCHCEGSSIVCSLANCKFRFDCEPEYLPDECCPRYDHCPPENGGDNFMTLKSTGIPKLFAFQSSSTKSSSTTSAPSSGTTELLIEPPQITEIPYRSSTSKPYSNILKIDFFNNTVALPINESATTMALMNIASSNLPTGTVTKTIVPDIIIPETIADLNSTLKVENLDREFIETTTTSTIVPTTENHVGQNFKMEESVIDDVTTTTIKPTINNNSNNTTSALNIENMTYNIEMTPTATTTTSPTTTMEIIPETIVENNKNSSKINIENRSSDQDEGIDKSTEQSFSVIKESAITTDIPVSNEEPTTTPTTNFENLELTTELQMFVFNNITV